MAFQKSSTFDDKSSMFDDVFQHRSKAQLWTSATQQDFYLLFYLTYLDQTLVLL